MKRERDQLVQRYNSAQAEAIQLQEHADKSQKELKDVRRQAADFEESLGRLQGEHRLLQLRESELSATLSTGGSGASSSASTARLWADLEDSKRAEMAAKSSALEAAQQREDALREVQTLKANVGPHMYPPHIRP